MLLTGLCVKRSLRPPVRSTKTPAATDLRLGEEDDGHHVVLAQDDVAGLHGRVGVGVKGRDGDVELDVAVIRVVVRVAEQLALELGQLELVHLHLQAGAGVQVGQLVIHWSHLQAMG